MKYSIIMMCHNSEWCIREAIDSVLAQTEPDFELLIIDDSTSDRTCEVVSRYDDIRIKYHVVNFDSVGKTINYAILKAQGEYISVLDPDDTYPIYRLKAMYDMAEGCDIVKGGWTEIDNNSFSTQDICVRNEIFKPIDLPLEERMEYFGIMPVWWNAIYRREFILENNIKAHETDGAAYQDNAWVFQANMRAERVKVIPGSYYNYNLANPTSSTHSSRYPMSIATEFNWIESFLEDNPYLNFKLRRILEKLRFTSYFWNLRRIEAEDFEKWKEQMQTDFKRNWEYMDCRLYEDKEWQLLKTAMDYPFNIVRIKE